ncbi:MAG: hypothetical protein J2P32_11255 [Actinobacteria bacterium]|nr:hypothetical protein [Actinomycetota bacterium]
MCRTGAGKLGVVGADTPVVAALPSRELPHDDGGAGHGGLNGDWPARFNFHDHF